MEENQNSNTTQNVIQVAVGLAVLFGTVYLISKAWKSGQM